MRPAPAVYERLRPFGWVRHIFRRGRVPYLDRYSLFRQGRSGANPCRAYLHCFMAADDPQLHNHPSRWSFSIVLRGSYTEERPDRPPRRVRWFNFLSASTYHRIAELHPRPGDRGVWTLFVCGPLARRADGQPRGWGFLIDGKHISFEEYMKGPTK